jgi:hypothetical protein
MNNSGDKIIKIKERMFYVSAVKWHDTVTLEIWKNTANIRQMQRTDVRCESLVLRWARKSESTTSPLATESLLSTMPLCTRDGQVHLTLTLDSLP